MRDRSLDDDNDEDDLEKNEEDAIEDDIEQVNNKVDVGSYCLPLTQSFLIPSHNFEFT